MKILLISDAYPPEVRSASRLMHEFATEMVEYGHDVIVLTGFPKYNLAEGCRRKYSEVEVENGITVIRKKVFDIHLVGMIKRGIGVMALPFFFIRAAKKYIHSTVDIILVYSPPLTLSITGEILSKLLKSKYILNIQDIFPQNAIDLGLLRNRILIRMFEMIEKNAYRTADFITVHSYGNMKMLIKNKNVQPKKISVYHNWVEIGQKSNKQRKNALEFRQQLNIEDNFIVLFGGVIGPAQGLEVALVAANYLRKTKVCFLIVGDGTEKVRLQKMATDNNLNNVIFCPFVSPEKFEEILGGVDLGLVTLSKAMKTPVVPGKLVQFMAHEIPVVASLNKESDGRKIIEDAGCGFVSDAGNGDQLAGNIKKLLESSKLVKEMGKTGRCHVQEHMSKIKVMKQYSQLFDQIR